MDPTPDANTPLWKSEDFIQDWTAGADDRERKNAPQWRLMAELLPFGERDAFTFLDLGAGTGSAARWILGLYPESTAVLADYSPQMVSAGEVAMRPFAGRFEYVEFDMSTGDWPAAIPGALDAVVTSMCIHHMPDHRKKGLFNEIIERLAPGAWYLNYDSVSSANPVVEAAWQRANDRDRESLRKRVSPTPLEQTAHEDHIRHVIPLPQQLRYLRSAGFQGVDVYWRRLERVIDGGHRPT